MNSRVLLVMEVVLLYTISCLSLISSIPPRTINRNEMIRALINELDMRLDAIEERIGSNSETEEDNEEEAPIGTVKRKFFPFHSGGKRSVAMEEMPDKRKFFNFNKRKFFNFNKRAGSDNSLGALRKRKFFWFN